MRAAIDLADKYGETPLFIASEDGNKEVIDLLLEHEGTNRFRK